MSKRSQRTKRSYPPVRGLTSASFGLDSNNQLFQLDGIRGPVVTAKSALGVPAVLNAVKAVSDDVAALPFNVFAEHAQEPDENHPLHRLFNVSPNALQTPVAFRRAMVVDMLCHGASVSEIVRNGRGEPTELWRIDPTRLTITPENGARFVVRVDGQEMDPADLLYVLYLSADGITPVSPLMLCKDSISLAISLERFAASFFRNGARPGGMLLVPPSLKKEDKENAKQNWENAHGGADNANRTAVMPTGYDYKPFQVTPEEGQFTATREAQVKQIERCLNVPAWVLKDEKTDIYSNRLDVAEDYVRHTLRHIAVAIEQACEKSFGLGDAYRCEHDFKAMLRGSNRDQSAYLTGLVAGGIITPNEGRDELGRPPLPGGDELAQKATPAGIDTGDEKPTATSPDIAA